MSGLYATLNTTVKALSAHSRAIEISGKNLANVNNTGYARQRVVYGDRGTVVTPNGAESLGLEALSVQQLRDTLLDRQVLREVSLSAAFTTEQAAYQRAQAALGQSIDRSADVSGTGGSTSGIAAALDDFFSAFQSFAASPTDTGERQTLLQKTAILTDRVQLTDRRLAQVQSDLNAQVASDVQDVNQLLGTIAELNAQIGRFEINAPGSAVDLRDQRLAKLEELSAKLPVEVHDDAGGQLQVTTKGADGTAIVLIKLGTVQGSVTFDDNQLTAGDPAAVVALGAGSIAGALNACDGAVQTLRGDLDALARQLVSSVNGLYNASGTSGDFFEASGTTAATLTLASTVTAANLRASDGGVAGDNSVALAIGQLALQRFSTGSGDAIDGTFSGFYSSSVSRLGQALAGATSRAEDQSNVETLVRSQRDAVSGVSLDEEMADLMKYQRAFQASSRVFTIVDDLLDVVVNQLGRG